MKIFLLYFLSISFAFLKSNSQVVEHVEQVEHTNETIHNITNITNETSKNETNSTTSDYLNEHIAELDGKIISASDEEFKNNEFWEYLYNDTIYENETEIEELLKNAEKI